MIILQGSKQHALDSELFIAQCASFNKVHIDIGTGSGRYLWQMAKREPDTLCLGLDPVASAMVPVAVKAAKQLRKLGKANLLFIVSSIENQLPELARVADSISVILPWGSLRDGLVLADPAILQSLSYLGKSGAAFYNLLGYDNSREEQEMQRRALPTLSESYFAGLIPAYAAAGLIINHISPVGNQELKTLESDWARRLAYGIKRTMYTLEGYIV